MRRSFVLALLALAACSREKPPGEIGGTLDLRAFLPDTLRQIASTQPDTSFTRVVRVGPDSAPVEVTWSAFGHGHGRFLGTSSARLTKPVRYDSLRFGNPTNLKNVGTKDSVNAFATLEVGWYKTTLFIRRHGAMTFGITARGR
jgi:hypothetical protein